MVSGRQRPPRRIISDHARRQGASNSKLRACHVRADHVQYKCSPLRTSPDRRPSRPSHGVAATSSLLPTTLRSTALTNTLTSHTIEPVFEANGRRARAPRDERSDSVTTERDRALQTALGQIERAHGKGAIMRLGEVQTQHIDIIPTGALTLDIALGVGGIPRGRIVEVYGPEFLREDDPDPACDRRGPASRWGGGVHRRGARPRPAVRITHRGDHRGVADLPTGYR